MDNPEALSLNDEWTSAYNPVEYERSSEIPEEKTKLKKKKREGKPLLIIIQIILSLILLLSLYGLKLFTPDLFKDIYTWYEKNLNNEIILSESFESFSLDNLINAVKDK